MTEGNEADNLIAVTMSIPELIEGLRQKYGSLNAAARACDLPTTTLFRLYKGERGYGLTTVEGLARGYGVSRSEMLRWIDEGELTAAGTTN